MKKYYKYLSWHDLVIKTKCKDHSYAWSGKMPCTGIRKCVYCGKIKNNTKAKELWLELGDIPINENEEIEERFLHFDIGTHREEIWHWFEDEFNLSVAEDLMYVNKQ